MLLFWYNNISHKLFQNSSNDLGRRKSKEVEGPTERVVERRKNMDSTFILNLLCSFSVTASFYSFLSNV